MVLTELFVLKYLTLFISSQKKTILLTAQHSCITTVKPGQVYPQDAINEFILRKLNPLAVVDFRLISAFVHV